MAACARNEDLFIPLVRSKVLDVREDGTILRRVLRTTGGSLDLEIRPATKWSAAGYGYVHAQIAGKRVACLAHRLIWRVHRGPILPGFEVNHRNGQHQTDADNAISCLELLTPKENHAHARDVLRRFKGEANSQARLSAADVALIRERLAAGETQRDVARAFGVSAPTISRISTGDRWTHVPATSEVGL
mgnify:CR=1 FL=1